MRPPILSLGLIPLIAITFATMPARGATITKLIDFNNTGTRESVQNPVSTPLVIGSELWFTSEGGGEVGFGTLASYNLASDTLTKRLDLGVPDEDSPYDQGNTPTTSFTRDGNLLYYTTTRGGTGDRGTLNVYNTTTGTNTTLWNSPANSPATNPNSPSGNVAIVDRGAAGKDVYFMTGNGGASGSGFGTIQRYNTATGLTTTVHEFVGGATQGRQPFEGFTQVGNKLYFNTFTGGNATTTGQTPASGNGAGTLSVLDVTTSGSEALSTLALLPLGDGSTRLPAHNPFYSAAQNALFFTTVGTAAQPGSLQKFDIATGTLITLYEVTGAPTSSGPFPDGRFIYGSAFEWGGSLYYATRQGGLYNGGTINQFDLASSTNTVLYDLSSDTGNNLGGDVQSGFAFSDWDGIPALYLLTRQGGLYDHGTLLRLDLVPEPSRALLLMAGLATAFLRRRRPASSVNLSIS